MKILLVIDGKKTDSYQDFKDRMITFCQDLSRHQRHEKIKVVLTDLHVPKISIIPFSKQKIAVVSLFLSNGQPDTSIFQVEGLRGAYLAQEALPVSYKKDWANGEATPGVNLLTLFRKKTGIDYPTFLNRWHNGHTPLSLKLHPLWNYNRNVIEENLKDLGVWYDGIVEEQVREKSDLLNPFKFFGNPLTILPNMINVYNDVKGFIDYSSIETYLANEYWIKD